MMSDTSQSDTSQFEHGSQKCCIQTKLYRLYRKMTIFSPDGILKCVSYFFPGNKI